MFTSNRRCNRLYLWMITKLNWWWKPISQLFWNLLPITKFWQEFSPCTITFLSDTNHVSPRFWKPNNNVGKQYTTKYIHVLYYIEDMLMLGVLNNRPGYINIFMFCYLMLLHILYFSSYISPLVCYNTQALICIESGVLP